MVDTLYRHSDTTEDGARVVVDPSRRGTPVDERLFGKFAEHLGRNIHGGMHAQIILNPTFGPWDFTADDDHPDGGIRPEYEGDSVRQSIRGYCDTWGLPDAEALCDAYEAGTAFGWFPVGDDVTSTPDASPEGDRAQRVDLGGEPGGLAQHTYFPFHRTDTVEVSARLRTTDQTTVTVGVYEHGTDPVTGDPVAAIRAEVGREWTTLADELTVSDAADNGPYTIAITAPGGVDLVLDRVTGYPDDHVNKADPEIVEYLRESDLPLLRWPGGNFVSGYDWRDGIGPADERPARVNPAWGHVEPNLFGTAEFVEFCEAVGCEPMICVNAGDGTPEEAAEWVEYCNGDPEATEMGQLRADHGYEEPFDIKYWEVGNELFGAWQVGWTTPSGNADRYRQFHAAMTDADESIEIQACGNRNSPENNWNEALIEAAGDDLRTITDHILTGGQVDAGTDPDELFHGSMGYARQLGEEYRDLRQTMRDAGIESPRLAITELQLFAHYTENREIGHHGAVLTPETMPARQTVSEPLYDATIIHECIRMGEFVQMLTHSATVNHGGGLRKKRERTWPDPAHHGHTILSSLAGGTPLGVDVACESVSTDTSFGDIESFDELPVVDAMAVKRDDGSLVLTIVNRRSEAAGIDLTLDVGAIATEGVAEVTTLSAETMHEENTLDAPDAVSPVTERTTIEDGEVSLALPGYGLTRVTIAV